MRLRYRYCGMNFVPALHEREKQRRNRHMLLILSPIALIAILMSAWLLLEMAGRRLERDRLQLLETAREQRADMAAGKFAVSGQADGREAFCRNASNVDAVLESGGRITKEMLSTVIELSSPRVVIENLEYRSGRLICDAFSGDYREASRYLQRVAETGLFESLEYNGFHRRQEGYSFTIECRLEQGKAGADNEAE